MIDAHVHFYDPSRPQGIPWPRPRDRVLYRTNLPEDYLQRHPSPHPRGVIAVEASPWAEDNQWVMDLAAGNPLIIGFIGNLPPGTREFHTNLELCAANPIFRGIRVKHPGLEAGLDRPEYLSDLRLLAERDLQLDVYGEPKLLDDVVRLSEAIPDLRIIINHLANVQIDGGAPPRAWCDGIRFAASHENVFCKVSALLEGTIDKCGSRPENADHYRPVLDAAWGAFGEDRLIFASNWPVCEQYAPLAVVQGIVFDYFSGKGSVAVQKAFGMNAAEIYRLPAILPLNIVAAELPSATC